jgi:transcriptional regulator with XRE-family HTH domain
VASPFTDAERRGALAIGTVVKRARRKLRITQKTLASHAGVSQPVISRLETGKLRGLKYRSLARVIAALSVGTKDWVGLVAEPSPRALPLEGWDDDEESMPPTTDPVDDIYVPQREGHVLPRAASK